MLLWIFVYTGNLNLGGVDFHPFYCAHEMFYGYALMIADFINRCANVDWGDHALGWHLLVFIFLVCCVCCGALRFNPSQETTTLDYQAFIADIFMVWMRLGPP